MSPHQQNTNRIWLAILVVALFGFTFSLIYGLRSEALDKQPVNAFKPYRVAHAGGAYHNIPHTNSIQALESNYRAGHRYFELDFSWTKDNHLVCLHDWADSIKRSFGIEPSGPLTYARFRQLNEAKKEYTKCTLPTLAAWLQRNPDAYIITDIKSRNMDALRLLRKNLPNAQNRVIPQVYHPQNFAAIKQLGFNQMIWTLYIEEKMSNDEIIQWARRFQGPVAITMPPYRAKTDLPKRLRSLGIPTYVHTFNTEANRELYTKKYGVTELYTDFLPPVPPAEIAWDFSLPLPELPENAGSDVLTHERNDLLHASDSGSASQTGEIASKSVFCAIRKWGPKKLTAGKPFNTQPDGSSAFWIVTDCAPENAVAYLDGKPLKTLGGPPQLAAIIAPGEEIQKPGRHRLTLTDPATGQHIEVGVIKVRPARH